MTVLIALAIPAVAHDDPEMQAEHDAMLALVPTSGASGPTRVAAASGAWSSPTTWGGASVPAAGSRVYIPAGATVTYDADAAAVALQWLRVNGKLTFSRTVNTALQVETIVVDAGGEWDQGNPASPIPAGVTSQVIFDDPGEIDTDYDTYWQSRGLLAHGKATIHGAAKTPFLQANGSLADNATSVTLRSPPSGWAAGDKIVVTSVKRLEDGTQRRAAASRSFRSSPSAAPPSRSARASTSPGRSSTRTSACTRSTSATSPAT